MCEGTGSKTGAQTKLVISTKSNVGNVESVATVYEMLEGPTSASEGTIRRDTVVAFGPNRVLSKLQTKTEPDSGHTVLQRKSSVHVGLQPRDEGHCTIGTCGIESGS